MSGGGFSWVCGKSKEHERNSLGGSLDWRDERWLILLLLLLLGWSKLRYIGELRDSICVLQVSCGRGSGGGDEVEGCDGFSSFSLFSTCHVWKESNLQTYIHVLLYTYVKIDREREGGWELDYLFERGEETGVERGRSHTCLDSSVGF